MSEAATKPAASAPAAKEEFFIVDLGRQTRRRIRQLRRGRGGLMNKVDNAVEALQEDGAIPADAAVVVVVVREKATLAALLDDNDDDDDDDDDDD